MWQPARYLALAIVMLLAGNAWGGDSGRIRGRVTDARSREALVGANILVEGTTMGATTDIQGDYSIANVPVGTYALRVHLVGYKTTIIQEIRVRADATTDLNIRLEETVVDIGEEIVITAERPLVQKDNTTTRTFIESAEITSRPVTSVPDVVALLPSVNVEGGELRVRGGSMNEVAFLVDGARARNPLDQQPYTNINLGAIEEMEIITGSFKAEYGEARSGVFNVITKEGSNRFTLYFDGRYTPPGTRHWGASLYDQGSSLYWENANARHLQWWIDNPDMWVDPNGAFGSDPASVWTPEQAYDHYLQTHQPLNDYTKTAGYSGELAIGGPVPLLDHLYFHASGRYRTAAPLMGNAYRSIGTFFDGSLKLTYQLSEGSKILLSGFLGTDNSGWGFGSMPDYFWAATYGNESRYAYYDFENYTTNKTYGVTAKYTHVIDASSMYEFKLSWVEAQRKAEPLPNDPLGWEASDAQRDNLRAYTTYFDSSKGEVVKVPIIGGYENRVGFNTTGYYFRWDDRNTNVNLTGFFASQLTMFWFLKTGIDVEYNILRHYNQGKATNAVDDHTYEPYQGAAYVDNKLELGGFIMNAGLRFDLYNPNDIVYSNIFDPLAPGVETSTSPTFSQVSLRLGVSHPIDESTVFRFSFGHFFQRGKFADYGEGFYDWESLGNLTTFVTSNDPTIPWTLGNRSVRPEKSTQYELGIERSFFEELVLGATAYYKDIRNTVRAVSIDNEGLPSVASRRVTYRTNGNGDYADVRGFELFMRKRASQYSWGVLSAYGSFTTQTGITGRSGDPIVITPTQVKYGPSGDDINYNNPRLKAGFYYQTPSSLDLLGGLFARLSLSVDYQAVFSNDQLITDFFLFEGRKYVRGADQNTNMRIRKDVSLGERLNVGLYVEVYNLFNNTWINLDAFEGCSFEEQREFVESDFKYLPTYDRNGTPILDLAKYRNLPRSFVFGVTIDL